MLYRFNIELSDIDHAVYETLDFRISQHPSEILPYLLTRVLAYALSYRPGLEFSPSGLSDPEAPTLQATGPHGAIDLWIEIGNPSVRKLHKAGKMAKQVCVYTYKSAEVLLAEIKNNEVHRADEIQIYSFTSQFLLRLENLLQKNKRWSVLVQLGQLDVTIGDQSISTEILQKK